MTRPLQRLVVLGAFAVTLCGCTTDATSRLREYGPRVQRYEAMRKTCDPDGNDAAVTKTGCPVCVY